MNVTVLSNAAAFHTIMRNVVGEDSPNSIRRALDGTYRLDWYGAEHEKAETVRTAFLQAEDGLANGAGAILLAFDVDELEWALSAGDGASGIGYTIGPDIGPTYACDKHGYAAPGTLERLEAWYTMENEVAGSTADNQ